MINYAFSSNGKKSCLLKQNQIIVKEMGENDQTMSFLSVLVLSKE